MIESVENAFQLALIAVCLTLAVIYTVREKPRNGTLLVMFYGSYLLGDLYWLLYLLFYGDNPSIFYIPDLSWYAAYGFLYLLLQRLSSKEERQSGCLPAWLTYDRAASILAVRHLFQGRGCTLFDFGTTLTVDLIDASGSYLGGNISPGCRTRFKALNKYSRSLPRIATPEKTDPVGTSLEGSIASGVISGILFEIEGYLALHPENVAVFTGGDANYFAKRMKNSIFAVCNLVLMGLALIAEEYED